MVNSVVLVGCRAEVVLKLCSLAAVKLLET